jgi:AcrR family transcriptional regulator
VPPRKQRTPELRQRLLDAAIGLLDREGVAAVTTRRVAALADATAPAIYELFDDKEGLVRAVFFEGFRRLGEALDQLPPPSGRGDDVMAAVAVFRTFTRENPALFDVMYSRPFADFSPTAEEQALGDSTRRAVVDRLRRCVEAGTLHGDPVDMGHAVLGLAIGLATQDVAGWLGSTEETRDRRWVDAAQALLTGYTPR